MDNYVEIARESMRKRLNVKDETLLNLYILLVLTKGRETSLEDVHDAWSIWKNTTRPDHWSIVPFNQLSVETKARDLKYVRAIVQTALELNENKTKVSSKV